MMDTKEWTAEEIKNAEAKYLANTYARFDVVITEGEGSLCRDAEGKEYVDFTSGIGVNSLGYADPRWVEAVSAQAAGLQHTSNLYYTAPMVRLAQALCEKSGMKRVFFANSGAEANECAIKAARKYGNAASGNQKNKIITLVDSFHGRTVSTLTATGQDHYHEQFFPFDPGFVYCPAGDIDKLNELVDESVCGIMMELIQGESGVLDVPEDFARAAAEICREKDILLIIDEIQTGVGRTGSFFCYEQYGLEPDLVSFAKGIGGGLPIGGVLFNEKTADVLSPGDHGSTFGANPVACAGALVVMERLSDDFLAAVSAKGDRIRHFLEEQGAVYDISGRGLMIGFRVKGREAKDVVLAGIEKGLLMLTAHEKVRLLPPLTISEEELAKGLGILGSILL